jgi:hypothetical protein
MAKLSGKDVEEIVRLESQPTFKPSDWRAEYEKLRSERPQSGYSKLRLSTWVFGAAMVVFTLVHILPHAVTLFGNLWLSWRYAS